MILVSGLFFPATANANSTIITTTVPSHCLLQVNIIGRGSVCIDGNSIHTSETLSIPRHGEFEIEFWPGWGYQLASVSLNGMDIAHEISSGKRTVDGLTYDSVLTVVFMKDSAVWPGSNPPTGDDVMPSAICCGVSVICLLILYSKKRRQ